MQPEESSVRPPLTPELNVETFRDFYWLGAELVAFCKENGINPSGPKIEVSQRIEVFLETGKIQEPVKRRARKAEPQKDLSLDTVITENHRCSQAARAFFTSVIPNFHFSTHIQNFFRDNVGATYRDAVNEWNAEEERKKDPNYTTIIGPQFEFNQFTRDFFADPANKGKTRKDTVAAWKVVKSKPGSNKYERGSANV